MASAFSHAVVALAMGKAFRNDVLRWRELSLGALCSAVPDLDVIGFPFGIQYGDLWGHRGLEGNKGVGSRFLKVQPIQPPTASGPHRL